VVVVNNIKDNYYWLLEPYY